MRKLCLVTIAVILIGCTVTKEQFQAHSLEASKDRCKSSFYKNKFCFEDSTLRINYNFWSLGGEVAFTIRNKTNDTVYLDWQNSNLTTNGFSSPYMLEEGNSDQLPASIPPHSSKHINEFKLNITFKNAGIYNYYTSPYLWENKIGYKTGKNDPTNYFSNEFWLNSSSEISDTKHGVTAVGYESYFYGHTKEEKTTTVGKIGYTIGAITVGVLYLASYALTGAETDSI